VRYRTIAHAATVKTVLTTPPSDGAARRTSRASAGGRALVARFAGSVADRPSGLIACRAIGLEGSLRVTVGSRLTVRITVGVRGHEEGFARPHPVATLGRQIEETQDSLRAPASRASYAVAGRATRCRRPLSGRRSACAMPIASGSIPQAQRQPHSDQPPALRQRLPRARGRRLHAPRHDYRGCADDLIAAAQAAGRTIRRSALTHGHDDQIGSLEALKQCLGDRVEVLMPGVDARIHAGEQPAAGRSSRPSQTYGSTAATAWAASRRSRAEDTPRPRCVPGHT